MRQQAADDGFAPVAETCNVYAASDGQPHRASVDHISRAGRVAACVKKSEFFVGAGADTRSVFMKQCTRPCIKGFPLPASVLCVYCYMYMFGYFACENVYNIRRK